MQTLDTTCVLRWLVRDDPAKTADMDALVAAGRPLRVPDVALIEAMYVLESHYRFTRDDVADAVRLVIGQAVFALDRMMWTDVLDQWAGHPKLSVTDVFLAVDAARRGDIPLVTFGRKVVTQLGGVAPAAAVAAA